MTIAPWCSCCTAALTGTGMSCQYCRVYLFCGCGERFCIPHQQVKMAAHCKQCKLNPIPSEGRNDAQ